MLQPLPILLLVLAGSSMGGAEVARPVGRPSANAYASSGGGSRRSVGRASARLLHGGSTASTPEESPAGGTLPLDSPVPPPGNPTPDPPSPEPPAPQPVAAADLPSPFAPPTTPALVNRHGKTKLTDLLIAESQNLFFSEHGRCGAATRHSQRCVEGYQAAFWQNVVAGLTVAMTLLPESVALALLAGLPASTGLWTSWAMAGVAALAGGRGGMVTGTSRSCAVVVAALVRAKGADHVPLAVLLAGLLQLAAGKARVGKYIRIVPHPVLLGFMNGLACLIFRDQLSHFRGLDGAWLPQPALLAMGATAALTVALVKGGPKLLAYAGVKKERANKVPASLLAIATATVLTKLLRLPNPTLGDLAGPSAFAGGWQALPKFQVPGLALLQTHPPAALLLAVLPYAASMAAVGLIESLLTMQLVDGLVGDSTRGSTSAECVGQGLANCFAAVTGGMGGGALMGQSLVNLDAGGTARLAGVVCSAALGLAALGVGPLLEEVPTGALVGLMLVVCHSAFSWSSLRLVGRIPRTDALVLATVAVTTVLANLAVAVVAGTVLSSLAFAWEMSIRVTAPIRSTDSVHGYDAIGGKAFGTARVYSVEGNVFFGSARHFEALFDAETTAGPALVFLDFTKARVLDHSGVAAIAQVCARIRALGKTPVLRRLSPDVASLLADLSAKEQTAGGLLPTPYIVETRGGLGDPQYGSAVNR